MYNEIVARTVPEIDKRVFLNAFTGGKMHLIIVLRFFYDIKNYRRRFGWM
jgi:hypothetical protein